jgi:uncharacterized membrane protein SpoIIM required for sporulation
LLLAIPTLLVTFEYRSWGTALANGYNQHIVAYSLWDFLPHAILESIANLTADGLGLWLGVKTLMLLLKKEHGKLKPAITYSLKLFIAFIIPILIVSAAIEAFV